MAMKLYSTFPKVPGVEHRHLMVWCYIQGTYQRCPTPLQWCSWPTDLAERERERQRERERERENTYSTALPTDLAERERERETEDLMVIKICFSNILLVLIRFIDIQKIAWMFKIFVVFLTFQPIHFRISGFFSRVIFHFSKGEDFYFRTFL